METKNHYHISLLLLKDFGRCMTYLQRKAFIFGCIEPDMNPLTYLKGSIRYQRLQGHNYENASSTIRKYMLDLEKQKEWSIMQYYKFGRLLHYVADVFTFPHNRQYDGNMREHVSYERKLHVWLEEVLDSAAVFNNELMGAVFHRYRFYEKEE